MADQLTWAEQNIGAFTPKLVELTDQLLFGDIWERPGLAKRDRSLITVAALIALSRPCPSSSPSISSLSDSG